MKNQDAASLAFVAVAATVGTILLIPLLAIWRGFVLSLLWAWLIAPVFGLATLSVPAAIGLALVVTFLTARPPKFKNEDINAALASLGFGVIGPLGALGVGWLVSLFL